jgi:SAM-dependent methyltransferase
VNSIWHPISALVLADPPVYATRAVLEWLLRAGPAEVVYRGDRMWPCVRDGARIVVEDSSAMPCRAGEVIVVSVAGAVDLLRAVGGSASEIVVAGDADPGGETRIARTDVVARARLPAARASAFARSARRFRLELREAWRHGPDGSPDEAATVSEKYDAQAPFYAETGSPDIDASLVQRITAAVAAGGRILVAGCGTGRESLALAALGYRVTGVDFAPAMIAAARAEAKRRGLAAEFTRADLRTVAYPAGTFDAVVFTYEVYSFLPRAAERVATLARIGNWLAPGGTVLLSARRLRGIHERLLLTLQWIRRRAARSREWGDTHTRWIAVNGEVHRSFLHVFRDFSLRREIEAAGFALETWKDGHGTLARRGVDCAVR